MIDHLDVDQLRVDPEERYLVRFEGDILPHRRFDGLPEDGASEADLGEHRWAATQVEVLHVDDAGGCPGEDENIGVKDIAAQPEIGHVLVDTGEDVRLDGIAIVTGLDQQGGADPDLDLVRGNDVGEDRDGPDLGDGLDHAFVEASNAALRAPWPARLAGYHDVEVIGSTEPAVG